MQETAAYFQTDQERGLTESEAAKRLAANGKNELEEEKKKTVPAVFIEQLNDPLIYVLMAAALFSFLLREPGDTAIIAVVIVINAIVGVIQEGKAQKALDSLKKLSSPHALVKRDGKIREIAASELVTGDLVVLETGAQAPADLRLTNTWNLRMEESALTGESVPVEKKADIRLHAESQTGERKNEAFMSAMTIAGRGEGIVIATGMETEIGKIAAMMKAVPKEFTPLQKKLAELGRLLSILSVLLCVLLFLIAVLQSRNIPDMLITAISLAVAAVPEGLPAVVTIVLAMSVSRMVNVNAIIRRLPSVETLGCVSVVCSDKTGTLTKNKMTVTQCYVDEKMIPFSVNNIRQQAEIPAEFLRGFSLCNDAGTGETEYGDPTEISLLNMAARCGIQKEKTEKTFPRIDECAFDSGRKMMTTLHCSEYGLTAYTKGAPDIILKHCTQIYIHGTIRPLGEVKRRKIQEMIHTMSSQALRVLALAMKREESGGETGKRNRGRDVLMNEKDMIFIGLAGMKDPIRPEAKEAAARFKEASVRTVMITGDYADTALAIAQELGIAKNKTECMTGAELEAAEDETLEKRLDKINVFARVSPEHKSRIVRLLKEKGNIVAMTGDGVNDAPSLRLADIGISMGMTGTDVAKNASDMILADDNFATIEKAIEEGRSIYKNIKKTVLFLLSSNFGEIITMFAAVLVGMASPLKASHILWINLITDSLPALALGVDENDKDELMKRPPRPAEEGLFADGGLACTAFYGILIAAVSLTAFLKLPWDIMMQNGMAFHVENISAVFSDKEVLTRAQTYAFTVLGMSQLFHALGMRDVRKSVFSGTFNPVMAAAFGIGLLLQLAVTEIPYLVTIFGTAHLAAGEWILLLILSAFPLLAHEVFVILFRFEAK